MAMAGGRVTGTDLDYDAIEAAVLETEKGRWFLAEHARRNRVANTEHLLDAIRKIELAIVPGGMGVLIEETRTDVAAIRNHMLEDGGSLANDRLVFQNVALEAKDIATGIMSRYEALCESMLELKSAGAETAALEKEINALQSLAWRADVSSQRVTRALALLDQAAPDPEPAAPPEKLTAKQLDYFKEDEEIFAETEEPVIIRHVPPPPAPKPVEAERPRIVLIRRAPGEDLPVPVDSDSAA